MAITGAGRFQVWTGTVLETLSAEKHCTYQRELIKHVAITKNMNEDEQ